MNNREERAWREGLWTGVFTTWACIAAIALKNRWRVKRSRAL